MAHAFADIRRTGSRVPLLAGVLLWVGAIATAWVVGIVTGLAVFVAAIPVASITSALDGGDIMDEAFTIGWAAPIVLMAVGVPVGMVFADRLGPWVVGARPVDESSPRERRILAAVQSVALAGGVQPLVLLIDADWIDVATVGRRGDRYTVITTTAAAGLNQRHLEILAATALADSVAGAGTARVRLATQMPLLTLLAAGRWLIASMRRARAYWAVAAIGLVAVLIVGSALTPTESGGFGAVIVLGPFLAFMAVVFIAAASLVGTVWLGALTLLARPLTTRAVHLGDVGSLALVRDPEQWQRFMLEAGQREPRTPRRQRLALATTLPSSTDEAAKRITAAAEAVPGARHSIRGARTALANRREKPHSS